MNNAECEETGINLLSSDLPPKIRPKSYSFIASKDAILKKNIAERVEDPEISKINSREKMSSLTNLHSHPKTRSFLRDFRKLFMKNKTSIDTTATSSKVVHNSLGGGVEMENKMEYLNDSIMQPRKKSRSWSYCDEQKLFRKYRKTAESRFTPVRAQRNNKKIEFIKQTVTKNTECGSTVYSKESSGRISSEQWQSNRSDAINNFYKSLKSKKTKTTKKQINEANNSTWILRLHGNKDSVLNENAVKKLKVYGYHCHLRLHQTYAVLQGCTKFLKLKILLPYKNIQQIRLIYANKRLQQIMIKMVKRKIRFTTRNHIFKDFCQLWRTAITLTNSSRKKMLRSLSNARNEMIANKAIFESNCSKTISFDNTSLLHAVSGNDLEQCEKQILVEQLGSASTATCNDIIDDNAGMDQSFYPSEELSSEVTCTTVSSTLSLRSQATASSIISMPDSEFSTGGNTICQEDNNNGITDNIETKVSCRCVSHLGRLLIDEVYPLTTEQLFNILFSPTPWYQYFQEIVNRTEHGRMLNVVSGYVATSWTTENPSVTTRTVTYNMALNNALGPKSTSVTEKQTYYAFPSADDGFSVIKEIQNAGIPCADNFIVQCTYCVIRAGHKHSRLLIHGAMIQKKSIWGIVKGIIEKNTYNGLETHYTVLEEVLKLLCEESTEAKQATVSKSEVTDSIKMSNLLPNKLLNGKYNSSKGNSLTEQTTATIVHHYRTKILKPIVDSAENMKKMKTANSNDCIYDDTVRTVNDAQTQTFNFTDKETIGCSFKFVIILLSILICLQLFTFLKISYISDIHCSNINANSAFIKPVNERHELPMNAQNLEQLPLTDKNTILKDDL